MSSVGPSDGVKDSDLSCEGKGLCTYHGQRKDKAHIVRVYAHLGLRRAVFGINRSCSGRGTRCKVASTADTAAGRRRAICAG